MQRAGRGRGVPQSGRGGRGGRGGQDGQDGRDGSAPPPQTPTPSRRVTRAAELEQAVAQSTPQSSMDRVLSDAVSRITIQGDIVDPTFNNCRSFDQLCRWLLPVSPKASLDNLIKFLNSFNNMAGAYEAFCHRLAEYLESNDKFNKLLVTSESLKEAFYKTKQYANRHRETVKQLESSRKSTKDELGLAFSDSYESRLGLNKSQVDQLRRLINAARERDIPFLNVWRMAWHTVLLRLRSSRSNATKHEFITPADVDAVMNSLKNGNTDAHWQGFTMPSGWTLDDNGIPWPSDIPIPRSFNDRLPRPLSWSDTEDLVGRRRNRAGQGGAGTGGQAQITKDNTLFGDSAIDPYRSPRTIAANIRALRRHEMTTPVREERFGYNPHGTPVRTLQQLASGWREGDPVVVPMQYTKVPNWKVWLDDWDSITDIEKALLTYHFEFAQYLFGNRPTPPHITTDPILRRASQYEIQDALYLLRGRVQFQPLPKGKNPYHAAEMNRLFWMNSIIQWLAGQQFGHVMHDAPWVEAGRGILRAINMRFPWIEDPNRRVNLSPRTSIFVNQFDPDHWLMDARGRYQGWATDDIVMGGLQLYARDHADVDIIDSTAFSVWHRMLHGDPNLTAAPVMMPAGSESGHARIVLVPMHVHNNHWVLGYINHATRQLAVLDSNGHDTSTQDLRHFLHDNGFQPDNYADDTTLRSVLQTNGADCGYFVIANARELIIRCRAAPITTSGDLRMTILNDFVNAINRYSENTQYAREVRPRVQSNRERWAENFARCQQKYGASAKQKDKVIIENSFKLSDQETCDITIDQVDQAFALIVAKFKSSNKPLLLDTKNLKSLKEVRDEEHKAIAKKLRVQELEAEVVTKETGDDDDVSDVVDDLFNSGKKRKRGGDQKK
jgi:hypothetical protein